MTAPEQLARMVLEARRRGTVRTMFGVITSLPNADTVMMRADSMEVGEIGPLPIVTGKPAVDDRVLAMYLPDNKVWAVFGKKMEVGLCGVELVEFLETFTTIRTDTFQTLPTLTSFESATTQHDFSVDMGANTTDYQFAITDADGHEYGFYLFGPPESSIDVYSEFPPFEESSSGATGVLIVPNPPDGSLRPYDSFFDREGFPLDPPGVNLQLCVDYWRPDGWNYVNIDTDYPSGLYAGVWTLNVDMNLGMGTEAESEGFLSGDLRITTWQRTSPDTVITFEVPEGTPEFAVRWDHPHWEDMDTQGDLFTEAGEDHAVVDIFRPDGAGQDEFAHLFDLRSVGTEIITAFDEDGFRIPLMAGTWTLKVRPRRLTYPTPLGVSVFCTGTGPPGSIHTILEKTITTGPEETLADVIPMEIPAGVEELGLRFSNSNPPGNAVSQVRLYRPGMWLPDPTIDNDNYFLLQFNKALDDTLLLSEEMRNWLSTSRANSGGVWANQLVGTHHIVIVRFADNPTGFDSTHAGTYTLDWYYRPWPAL